MEPEALGGGGEAQRGSERGGGAGAGKIMATEGHRRLTRGFSAAMLAEQPGEEHGFLCDNHAASENKIRRTH